MLAQEQRQDLPLVVRLRGGLTVGSPLALFEPVHQHMRFFTMNMKVLFAHHHLVEARPCFASNNVIVTLLRYASSRQKLSLCMSKTSFHSHCDSRWWRITPNSASWQKSSSRTSQEAIGTHFAKCMWGGLPGGGPRQRCWRNLFRPWSVLRSTIWTIRICFLDNPSFG